MKSDYMNKRMTRRESSSRNGIPKNLSPKGMKAGAEVGDERICHLNVI